MSDFEFLAYDEAAKRLNIAVSSVKRQATRRKWPKRRGNDGRALVGIPVARLSGDNTPDSREDSPPPAHLVQLARLDGEIATLRALLDAERDRRQAAEVDRDAWRTMAQRPWWRRLVTVDRQKLSSPAFQATKNCPLA